MGEYQKRVFRYIQQKMKLIIKDIVRDIETTVKDNVYTFTCTSNIWKVKIVKTLDTIMEAYKHLLDLTESKT